MNSPIKYYGGKSNFTDILIENFPSSYDIYIEGFGGGASLLFSKEISSKEVYNDLGKNVYSLFKVLSDKEMFYRFKEKLDLTYYSSAIREDFKILLKRDDLNIEDRAYYYFYVNRSSFNGVGGFSKNLIVRRNMCKSVSDYLSSIDKLPEIHERLSRVIVTNDDIFKVLEKYNNENIFIYLDPPYIKDMRLSNQKYEVEMSVHEHEKLVDMILHHNAKILLSGYNHAVYNIISDKWGRQDFRSPNSKSLAIESLWRNY